MFDHHVWATISLIGALEELSAEQLGHPPRPPAALRTEIQGNAARWGQALERLEAGTLDTTIEARDDYPRTEHAEGLLLVQAVHHRNDHRT